MKSGQLSVGWTLSERGVGCKGLEVLGSKFWVQGLQTFDNAHHILIKIRNNDKPYWLKRLSTRLATKPTKKHES